MPKFLIQIVSLFASLAIIVVVGFGLYMLISFSYEYGYWRRPSSYFQLAFTSESTRLGFLEFIELADSPEERSRGMMYRKSVCDTCGMLFVFDSEQVQNFWMKNTFISLDMIFMNKEGYIVKIHQNTKPLREFPTYSSDRPSRYVLEVPAGTSQKYQLKEGQKVDIDDLLKRTTRYRYTDDSGAFLN